MDTAGCGTKPLTLTLSPFWGRFLQKRPCFSLPHQGGGAGWGVGKASNHAEFFPLPLTPSRLGEGGNEKTSLVRTLSPRES
jgi:hypothetical protein